jgi:hypothetical protein
MKACQQTLIHCVMNGRRVWNGSLARVRRRQPGSHRNGVRGILTVQLTSELTLALPFLRRFFCTYMIHAGDHLGHAIFSPLDRVIYSLFKSPIPDSL